MGYLSKHLLKEKVCLNHDAGFIDHTWTSICKPMISQAQSGAPGHSELVTNPVFVQPFE